MNPKNLLRRLWTTPPQDVARRIMRRVRKDSGEDYSLQGILRTRHLNFNLIVDKWERYWRVLQTQHPDDPADQICFDGRVMIELGCGPLLGQGPLALFEGARRFYYSDPAIRREVVESNEIKERYFRPLFQDLVVNLGDRGEDFESFHARLLESSRPLADMDDKEGFADVVFSNSVLEHITRTDLPEVLARLRSASAPGSYYMHVVDFGAHRVATAGLTQLETLYQQDWQVEKPGINYLRLSDTVAALVTADLAPTRSTIYRRDPVDRSKIHASWRHYSDEDLGARVVILEGKTPSSA